jgi:hypothetical protein
MQQKIGRRWREARMEESPQNQLSTAWLRLRIEGFDQFAA